MEEALVTAVVAKAVVGKLIELSSEKVSSIIAAVKSFAVSGQQSKKQAGGRRRPEEVSVNSYALLQAYVLMAVTGLGYLALTWSTVVLLGGFVTSLGKKDFWCLTSISMIQAARIFNDSGDNLFPILVNLTDKLIGKVFANPIEGLMHNVNRDRHPRSNDFLAFVSVQFAVVIVQILSVPALLAVLIATIIYAVAPVTCIALSAWRIGQRDYGDTQTDNSKANLVPALDIFYCLVICQGLLFFLWWAIDYAAIWVVKSLREECKLPEKWGNTSLVEYLFATRLKCWRDPASVDGVNLINYAVELLDSGVQKDYLSAARMLDTFIKLEADVRSLLLPSRPKIQKLIDTLGWRSSDREIRELVARIIMYLAGDIHLSRFPGSLRCISSMLDTTLPYWKNPKQSNQHLPESKSIMPNSKERLILGLKSIEEHRQEGDAEQDEVIHGGKGDCWNELILQGLAILERLAFDENNCRDILSAPDILSKITAPLYSSTLIQDISVSAWADVANGSLKVVHRLIRAPEWIGKTLVLEISASKQAVSNLEGIVDHDNKASQELQMRAIEILTELAVDSSTNLSTETKEKLIKKQLHIFLTDDEGEEEKLRVTAGKALALLSKTELLSTTGTISMFIMSKYSYIIDHVTELLDAKNKIIYRTIAAAMLENLCTHHTMDKENVKNTLLPKILAEVMTSKREDPTEASQSNMSAPEDNAKRQENSATGDEENQLPRDSGQIKSPGQASEDQTTRSELQEALLSLTLVICDKQIISTDDFDAAARKIALGDGEFVAKLKDIVQTNCQATPDCLRVVKLCGQIAVSMMRRGQYTAHFKDQKFTESLSKASEIMSNLESCMLFAGTDCGVKNTARPLLWDIAKEALEMVDQNV